MKKFKLLVAVSVLCTGLQSQPYTGLDTYQHFSTNILLTDGSATSLNSNGFILGGYCAVTSAANPYNLYIDKTDDGGQFTTLNDFNMHYTMVASNIGCVPATGIATNCYGMSIVEVSTGGADWYAMTAAFNRGCLFATLDNTGAPVTSAYYTFPSNATNPTKPLITKSATSGRYYISGSYQVGAIVHMYVLKLTTTGGLTWSVDYVVSTSASELVPSAIMESPYAPVSAPELVIVGTYNNGSTLLRQGFFTRLNGTNGAVVVFNTYGTTSGTNEQFFSVSQALNPNNGNGYIVGGYSDSNPANTAWMVKLKSSGSFIWSKLMQPSTGIPGSVVGTRERFNTYGTYEYYGTATDNNGMTVYKVDGAGNPFSQGSNNTNEFIYNDNSGNIAIPAAITYKDNGGNNDGIHVFGTDNNNPSMGNYFMVRACFNGAAGNAGCTVANINLNSTLNTIQGPFTLVSANLTQVTGVTACNNFNFTGTSQAILTTAPCDEITLPTTPFSGDQGRPALATGIKSTTAFDKFSLSPNPVNDKLQIRYFSNTGSDVSIGLYNNLGQLVTPAVTPKVLQGTNTMELDMDALNINSGVYFVTLTLDGVNTTKKIIYTK